MIFWIYISDIFDIFKFYLCITSNKLFNIKCVSRNSVCIIVALYGERIKRFKAAVSVWQKFALRENFLDYMLH